MLSDLPHAGFSAQEPPDRDVRRAALDPEGSFAVSAPAGSGKTGLLTQRLLTLLARCDAPEEILAITFTRKAAGEMQDRIVQALWQAHSQPAPDNPHARFTWELARAVLARDEALNWQLLLSPQRLRVQTIDSLCRALTRQMPLASGLGAQPDTLEDAEPAYRQAVREFLSLLEKDHPLRDDLALLLRHLDNNLGKVESLLIALLARREQWLGHLLQGRHQDARAFLEQNLQAVIGDHLQHLRDALLVFNGPLCEIASRAARYLQEEAEQKNRIGELDGISVLPSAYYHDIDQWLALADLLLTKEGGWRSSLRKTEGFPPGKHPEHLAHKQAMTDLLGDLQASGPAILELLQDLRNLPAPRYDDNQWQLLDSLTRLLPLLTAQLNLTFQQLGATDYTTITQAALQALGDDDDPSDLALQLDYRIRHILVDEFQDTSGPQLQLLQKLITGWQPGDGRTLFIVGDGMQSCYGFRDANVGLFLDARRQGIGQVSLQPLDLQVNFRSQAGIVAWVNDTFYHAFPVQDDIGRGAVRYSPSIAFNPALACPAVQTYVCSYVTDREDNDDEDISTGRQQATNCEAEAVLALVQQARREDPDGTVAVLVRNRSHLIDILASLSAAGLSWQATEIDSLSSRMAIMDLNSLTRALLDPGDRIAWLSLLRAPWCGLDLHDLHALANTRLPQSPASPRDYPVLWPQIQHHADIAGISHAGHRCLERIRGPLQQVLDGRRRKPLRQWIEGIWLALGGPACLLDSSDTENVQSYFALLDKHQEGGDIRDWAVFNRALQKLYAKPRADADPRLQVMTIHKSKGLEFDTVIMPGLDRRPRNDDSQLLLWQERLNQEGEHQLLLGPLSATGDDKSPIYQHLQQEARKRQRYEETRLLYVGCTRAIKRLYLLACLQQKNDEIKAPSADSLLTSIWPVVKDQWQAPPANAPAGENTETPLLPGTTPLLRLHPDWQRPALTDTSPLTAYRGHEYQDEDNTPKVETRSNRLARHTGTLLHRALQTICERGLARSLSDRATLDDYLHTQYPFWALQLRRQGWQEEEQRHALSKVQRAITRMLDDERGRWLLDDSHDQSACELSLYQQDQHRLREYIIDRTFIAGGVRWLVDYKSSEPQPGQDVEDFIRAEVGQYREQLQRYHHSFTNLGEHEIRTALYFPLLDANAWVVI